jgi:hypothetical protein
MYNHPVAAAITAPSLRPYRPAEDMVWLRWTFGLLLGVAGTAIALILVKSSGG